MIKTAHLLTFLFFLNSFAYGQGTTQEKPDYHLGFRIAPRISTLGGGLEFAKGLTPSFGLRGGFNYFTYGYDATESDVEYNLDLELKSLGLFADWHPFKGSFRLSGGFLINGNGIEGKAKPTTANFDIGDGSYALNSASLEISYDTFAPYFGLGWDTTFGDRDNWGFALILAWFIRVLPRRQSLFPEAMPQLRQLREMCKRKTTIFRNRFMISSGGRL